MHMCFAVFLPCSVGGWSIFFASQSGPGRRPASRPGDQVSLFKDGQRICKPQKLPATCAGRSCWVEGGRFLFRAAGAPVAWGRRSSFRQGNQHRTRQMKQRQLLGGGGRVLCCWRPTRGLQKRSWLDGINEDVESKLMPP